MRTSRAISAWFLFLLSLFLWQCGGGNPANHTSGDRESSQEAAAGQDSLTTGLSYIRAWQGKRPAEVNLWAYKPLQSRLMELLGEEDFNEFVSYMQEAMPIEVDGQLVYTVGVVPDDAVRGVAYLLVLPEEGRIKAFGIFGDHKIEARSPGWDPVIPEAVQGRVESVLNLQ